MRSWQPGVLLAVKDWLLHQQGFRGLGVMGLRFKV